ncbi:hypothetical protein SLA2020_266900 [Shorea laevis]
MFSAQSRSLAFLAFTGQAFKLLRESCSLSRSNWRLTVHILFKYREPRSLSCSIWRFHRKFYSTTESPIHSAVPNGARLDIFYSSTERPVHSAVPIGV